eukprot:1156843-Pelagomonas_calceolata.AAC.9
MPAGAESKWSFMQLVIWMDAALVIWMDGSMQPSSSGWMDRCSLRRVAVSLDTSSSNGACARVPTNASVGPSENYVFYSDAGLLARFQLQSSLRLQALKFCFVLMAFLLCIRSMDWT